jgi:hypothetical protein
MHARVRIACVSAKEPEAGEPSVVAVVEGSAGFSAGVFAGSAFESDDEGQPAMNKEPPITREMSPLSSERFMGASMHNLRRIS